MERDNEMKQIKKEDYRNKLDTISLIDEIDYGDNNLLDVNNKHRTPDNNININKMERKLLNKSPEQMENIDYIFKIIFAGDTNTGKTTICNTLIDRNLKTMQYQPTIGIDFNSLVKKLHNNKKIKVQLWDTAGQEKYHSIITSYFRNICSAIVTYDITNQTSFMRVAKWINDLNRFNCCTHYYRHPILLLGTKADLPKERRVSFDEAYQFSLKNNLIFREINSFELKGNLENGFNELLQTIYSIVDEERIHNSRNIPTAEPYPSHTENLTINLEAPIATLETHLITCKGVKYLQNDNEIVLSKKSPITDESPKICSKCTIS